MVTPSLVPLTSVGLPTCLASAPLFSRNTVTTAGVPEPSLSVTVMTPWEPLQVASAENSLMSQASALPAALSASAAEPAATPRMRTERAVRRDMEKMATVPFTGCAIAGG